MSEINYDLLTQLADKPHPLLNVADDAEKQFRETPVSWLSEVFVEARTAHHLFDIAGIPHGESCYSQHLDARAWLAITKIGTLRDRLDRIKAWHSRECGPAGMVGDYCNECETRWPCDTWRMADGTYTD